MALDQKRRLHAALIVALLTLLAGCATTPTVPKSSLPILVDPRVGYEGPSSAALDKRLLAAWRKLTAGDVDGAEKDFASLASKNPSYAPATLGRAVTALAKGQLELAERHVEKVANPGSAYFAAEAYRAEIALARDLNEDAWRNYKRLTALPGVPTIVSTRMEHVTDLWFEELVARAGASDDTGDRIVLLSEAVAVRPRSDSTRIALVKELASAKSWTETRAQVDVLLDRGLADNPDVQSVLADLEASDGRYQEAIVRLERLASRYPGRGYEGRLSEVKFDYMRANLPPRYNRAAASQAITRADLAILAYWHVSSVRFASVSEPPIAVDIANVPGRDEIVRALGLGLLTVDPATRTFGPDVTVNARAFLNMLARLMRTGPAPACASGLLGTDAMTACGVDLSEFVANPSATLSGRRAVEALNEAERLLASAK